MNICDRCGTGTPDRHGFGGMVGYPGEVWKNIFSRPEMQLCPFCMKQLEVLVREAVDRFMGGDGDAAVNDQGES